MAAGQGFKTFNTGDVLAASDVNGYLMQGIWVFDNATARDAAVTSPQEGNACYLKDTNLVYTYNGSAWGSIDTTGMTNPMTTTGDTIYSSSGSTPARLGIGSTGQVLTVAGGVPSWATASSGGMTLLSTTSATAVASINITGISSAYKSLFILIEEVRPATNAVDVNVAFYASGAPQTLWVVRTTWPNGAITHTGSNSLTVMPSSTNTNPGTASITLNNYSVAKQKTFSGSSYNYGTVGPNGYCSVYGGGFNGSSITNEVRISVSSGVFDATGNIYIYGVK